MVSFNRSHTNWRPTLTMADCIISEIKQGRDYCSKIGIFFMPHLRFDVPVKALFKGTVRHNILDKNRCG